MITAYQKLILDMQNEISEEITIMKRVISFFLCVIMLMLSTYTALAKETTDISYNTLSVEFSDNLGTTEELNVMVTEEHLYVDAEQLGDRLGYQVEVGNEYVAIYNKNFSNTVPYGLTTFYYDSTKVRHMLFNKMVDYEAPFKIVKNSDGVWIPFEFSLLLLNSSDVVLDNQVHIEMPQKNIVDIYMDILKNNDRYLFDWKSDAGASEGSIFAMGTGAYFVQVFSGILDKDGASWSQLIDSFYLKMDSYDRKYAESFARMFCTYSDEELTLNAKAMKEKMKPFNGDNWVAKSIKKVDDIIDDNIGDLSKKTADLKKRIDVENGTSVAKFNKSYQELDKMNKWDEYSNNIKGYTISFFSNYTPKKSKEDIDAGIYEKFIKNGEYNNYLTSDWEYGMPSQYAVLDIDGNGVDELIIYGNENEWGNIIVFTYKGDTQEIVPIQANLYDTGDTSRKTNVIWFCKNMEYSPQYHALAFTDSHYGVGNEDYLYYTINNDVFDIAFDVSAFTNYNTGDIRYSKGGINVERNDISESDYEAYINELKPIEWKKLP